MRSKWQVLTAFVCMVFCATTAAWASLQGEKGQGAAYVLFFFTGAFFGIWLMLFNSRADSGSMSTAGTERAQAISREKLEKLFEEYVPLRPMHPEAKGYMFKMLTAELNEAASPVGRAEPKETK